METHSNERTARPLKLLGYEDASKLLGVTVNTLYTWVHRKRIPHVRLSRRCVRFSVEELLNWLDDHAVEMADESGSLS